MTGTMLRLSLAAVLSATLSLVATVSLAEGSTQADQAAQPDARSDPATSTSETSDAPRQQRIAARSSNAVSAEQRNREIVESVTGNLHPVSAY